MIEPNTERKQVAIIGAGITGLSAAYHLQQAGHCVVIFENTDHVGGVIKTSKDKGFLCEHGPNSILVNDQRVNDLIDSVGLRSQVTIASKAAKKRFIVADGKLQPLPSSPGSFLRSPLFSLKAKVRLLKEPFISKRPDNSGSESFSDFIRRRLGPEILEKAAGPFVSGIYAGDPSRLSTRYAFPKIYELEQAHGSLVKGGIKMMRSAKKAKKEGVSTHATKREILSFKEGMASLPLAIAEMLEEGTLFQNTQLDSINYSKKTRRWKLSWKGPNSSTGMGSFTDLIVTVPAHKLGSLPFDDKLMEAVSKVPNLDYPPVATMLLGFKREQVKHPLDGFGMLNSLSEKSKLLGALFTSTLFPGRAPDDHVCINVMLGGSRTPEHSQMSESAMKASAMDELRRLLGIDGNPVFTSLVRCKKAIPQANIGYGNILKQIELAENKFPGIHFAGNYRGGISVGDCILTGLNLSKKISS